jgi:oxygen-independent coproporphyrinogen-3 oxidase
VVAGSHGIRSVYVHAPFCVRRCVYCDFAVTVQSKGDVDGWATALAAEVAMREREGVALAEALDTLYVGGGTPSLLGGTAMRRLAEVVGASRLTRADLEWTAEANPESFSPELGGAWRDAGVNRLSLGVQSFHEPTLRWMGRVHGSDGARRAVRDAKDVGISNLSVDLVFALPAHLGRPWTEDLERALDLDVPHVSLYGLSVEPATALGRAVAEGKEPGVDEERYREEFLEAAERFTRAGYEHYEVSNFARPGYASRHNAVYWDGRPYLGLGNGAHSYVHPVRWWNTRDWAAYRGLLHQGKSPEEDRETIDAPKRSLEGTWLGLRTSAGLEISGLSGRARELAIAWERGGLAIVTDGRVRLTPEGWLLLDRLSVELDSLDATPTREGAG